MFAGERKIYLLFSPVSGLMLYVECWQAVDGILFQLVNGTGVFLCVFQTAYRQKWDVLSNKRKIVLLYKLLCINYLIVFLFLC